ncbi:MAG: hypothetical protein ACO1N6_00345 [Microcella sp.]
MPRPLALALVPLLLLAAALTGCTQPTRLPPPEPSASGEPLFASDEEALAAATAAYKEYLAVSNAVTANPSVDMAELSPLTTSEYYREVSEAVSVLRRDGLRTVGSTRIQGVVLQQWAHTGEGAEVAIYVCLDVSGALLLDAEGQDVTPSDRSELVPLEVTLVSQAASGGLLVARSDSWPQGDVCDQ